MKKQIRLLATAVVFIAMSLCVSCNKDDEEQNGGSNQTVATVTTDEVTEITATTAICGGEVTSENGCAVTERGVCWSTEPKPTPSDSHTVDGDGIGKFISEITGLTPDTKYYLRAYAKNAAGTSFGPEKSFTTESGGGGYAGHEYVDLGLSVKWATCNVGATSPEDYGDYFAWGETTAKSNYDWTTYKWCDGSWNTLTKYNTKNSSYGIVDNKTVLDLADDAAAQNWGDGWRTPTREEWEELLDHCTSVWTTQNGVRGQRFTEPNGNTLFLPAAGCRWDNDLHDAGSGGHYWSSSLCIDYPDHAWGCYFCSGNCDMYGNGRYYGHSVRAVRSAR